MAGCLSACLGKRKNSSSSSSRQDATATATATEDLSPEEQKKYGPVVVELFTSQGCATSLEAEQIWSRLGRGDLNLDVAVILLAYHVDYWDYKGWKDPFGSSQWTVRQKAYVEALNLDTIFTAQVVVQGRAQSVGNEEDNLLACIMSASRFPAPTLQAKFKRLSPESLQVSINGALRAKVDHEGVNIMVALYESGMVTNIDEGDNKDKVITNDFVVRRLEKLSSVKDLSPKKTISGSVDFSLWEGFKSNKCGVAVFVQNGSHQIFGSQDFKLPENL